jgi:hypothetical protein
MGVIDAKLARLRVFLWGLSLGLGLLHFFAAFFAWAVCDGPKATASSCAPWNVLSSPVFHVFPADLLTAQFYPALILNSAIWTALLLAVATALTRRKASANGGGTKPDGHVPPIS